MAKELREHIQLKETITLGNKVVVSDPCYDLDTWCQGVINNVKPGEYHIDYYNAHDRWDGHAFCLTHVDYSRGTFPKEHYPASIGMDAGMAGVFPFEEYRNDSIIPKDYQFAYDWMHDGEGERWYSAVIPIDPLPFRIVGNGFNSESGYGDGEAELRVSTNAIGEIYRIALVF